MRPTRKILLLTVVAIFSLSHLSAQVEGIHLSSKNYKAFGYGAFLNLAFPVSHAGYLTVEGGFRQTKGTVLLPAEGAPEFSWEYEQKFKYYPVLLGYRHTLNRSGLGFYLEPFAGYTFTKASYLENSPGWCGTPPFGPILELEGITTGVGFGYLFKPVGIMNLNLGLRYDHSYGDAKMDVFALRLSHSFTIGRKK